MRRRLDSAEANSSYCDERPGTTLAASAVRVLSFDSPAGGEPEMKHSVIVFQNCSNNVVVLIILVVRFFVIR